MAAPPTVSITVSANSSATASVNLPVTTLAAVWCQRFRWQLWSMTHSANASATQSATVLAIALETPSPIVPMIVLVNASATHSVGGDCIGEANNDSVDNYLGSSVGDCVGDSTPR